MILAPELSLITGAAALIGLGLHFVWDNLSPILGKVDGRVLSGPANQALTSTEWNTESQFLADLKDGFLAARYHQFLANATPPLSGGGFAVLAFMGGQMQVSINGGPFGPISGVALPVISNMPSGVGATILYNGAARRGRFAATLDWRQFQTAANSINLRIGTLGGRARITSAHAIVSTRFLGGTITAVTLQCGSSLGTRDEVWLAKDVFTATTSFGAGLPGDQDYGVWLGRLTAVEGSVVSDLVGNGNYDLHLRMVATGANLSALTQGSITYWIEYDDFSF